MENWELGSGLLIREIGDFKGKLKILGLWI
jgi:hypothetical protein